MTLHRSVLTHKCDKCEKAFVTLEHLTQHVQEYHVDRPYVCSICNKPFSRGEHLIRHLKVHDKDGEEKAEHKCSICEKVFQRYFFFISFQDMFTIVPFFTDLIIWRAILNFI